MLTGRSAQALSAAIAAFAALLIIALPAASAEPPPEVDSGMRLASVGSNSRYPEAAVKNNIEGWVLINLTVNPDGTVKEAGIVKSEPEGVFEEAAIARAKGFVFKPRMVNGSGIEVPDVQWVIKYALGP